MIDGGWFMTDNSNYVIISSSGKAGSNLLLGLFDWHPELLVYGTEENVVLHWLRLQKKFDYRFDAFSMLNVPFCELKSKDVFDFYKKERWGYFDKDDSAQQEIMKQVGMDFSNVDYQLFLSKINSFVKNNPNLNINQWFALLFEAYRSAIHYKGKEKYKVFKTTDSSVIARYTDAFPNAKVIHLVRHPYSVLDSLKRTEIVNLKRNYCISERDLLESFYSKFAAPSLKNADNCLADPQKHYLVKYEDLVADPQKTMESLFTWLDIKSHPDGLSPTMAGKPFKGYSSNKNLNHNAVINSDRVNDYRGTVGSREIRFIDHLLSHDMKKINYDVTYESSIKNFLMIFFGLFFPLKMELQNFNRTTIVGMISKRCFMLNKIIRATMCDLLEKKKEINEK